MLRKTGTYVSAFAIILSRIICREQSLRCLMSQHAARERFGPMSFHSPERIMKISTGLHTCVLMFALSCRHTFCDMALGGFLYFTICAAAKFQLQKYFWESRRRSIPSSGLIPISKMCSSVFWRHRTNPSLSGGLEIRFGAVPKPKILMRFW